jgi:hypothetical protein
LSSLRNGESPRISDATLREIGIEIGPSTESVIITSETDATPVTYELHEVNAGMYIGVKVLRKQAGDEPVHKHLIGIGGLDLEPVSLDTDALRERLENEKSSQDDVGLQADVDTVVEMMDKINKTTSDFILGELTNGTSWGVFSGSRVYVHRHIGPGYFVDGCGHKDLDKVDKDIIRTAISRTHGARGSGVRGFNFPHSIHYVLDVNFDNDVSVKEITEES